MTRSHPGGASARAGLATYLDLFHLQRVQGRRFDDDHLREHVQGHRLDAGVAGDSQSNSVVLDKALVELVIRRRRRGYG